jgi:F-type H+-transporting ATPase subunit b
MLNLIICSVLNFSILLFLLLKFVVPRMSEAMAKKQQGIVQTVEEAEKTLADINRELSEHAVHMRKAEAEVVTIAQEAEARAEAAARKIQQDTVQEVEALRVRVERQIEQEFHNLKLRLRADLINQVVATAQDLAQKNLDSKGHTSLIENFALVELKDFKEFKS